MRCEVKKRKGLGEGKEAFGSQDLEDRLTPGDWKTWPKKTKKMQTVQGREARQVRQTDEPRFYESGPNCQHPRTSAQLSGLIVGLINPIGLGGTEGEKTLEGRGGVIDRVGQLTSWQRRK